MGTGQVHKEVYEARVKEQIGAIDCGNLKNIDLLFIKMVLADSIKFYYGE